MMRSLLVAGMLLLAGCACKGDGFCAEGEEEKGQAPPEGTERWCERGGVKHGRWVRYHAGSQPAEEGQYKDGKKFGRWTEWYEDGAKKIDSELLGGQKVGLYVRYHRNGSKASEGTYTDGRMDGVWTEYHDNGKPKLSGQYVEGKRTGRWTSYDLGGDRAGTSRYKDGVEVEKKTTDRREVVNVVGERVGMPDPRCGDRGEIFGAEPPVGDKLWCERDGKKNGPWRQWWGNGNRWIEGEYTEDRKSGFWTEWYDNGHITSRGEFKDGRRSGRWVENYANGNRRTAGAYLAGAKVGVWKVWHEDGRSKKDEVFSGKAPRLP